MPVEAPIPRPAAPTVAPDVRADEDLRLSPDWKVILLDDSITTFEFVIELLQTLFRKKLSEALLLTHEVHNSGSAMITVTTKEHAELYVEQVRSLARPRGYPLTATIEPA